MSITSSVPADASPDPVIEAPQAPPARRTWHRKATIAGGTLVVVVFAILAYRDRWISDDGLIVVREVRQILAGNGPNYNPFQRDEVDTSVLWTWLLALVALVVRHDIGTDAVILGLECSIAGMVLALLGSARFHRARGATGLLVPAGAVLPVAVVAFWDFASSGLETGLSTLWLGLSWWLLTGVTETSGRRRMFVAAVVIGLGWLVRPDFALVTIVFGAALLLIRRPRPRTALGYVGAGVALPVAYQIFRMGYYGLTVPMPALAKEASKSFVSRGLIYLNDFVDTYQLWIPLVVLTVVATWVAARGGLNRRTVLLAGAPVLSGVLVGAYVVWVGGDYMHARMFVPVVFALLLPVLLLPVGWSRLVESIGVALLVLWAIFVGFEARTPYQGIAFGPDGITNERSYEVAAYGIANPVTSASRDAGDGAVLLPQLRQIEDRAPGRRLLVISSGVAANGPLWAVSLNPALPDHGAFFYNNMGITDQVVPLDGTVVDVNGLASPVAGHLLITQRGRPGHEKWLPVDWVVAEYASPSLLGSLPAGEGVDKREVLAARHALTCGKLKDLLDSVNQPMSPGRFWSNLTGSIQRTSLRVPADPIQAEREFCG